MKGHLVCIALLLSGCTQTPDATALPLVLAYNEQLQLLIVQGVESGHNWENVTINVSGDDGCSVTMPLRGPITTLDKGEVSGGRGIKCHIEVYYDRVLAWKGDTGLISPERGSKTWSVTT